MRRTLVLLVMCALAACRSGPARAPAATPSERATPGAAQTSKRPEGPRYLDDAAIARLEAVLPAPPTERGPLARGEGDLMLAIRAEAAPAAAARAKSEENLHVWLYADVLGPGFTAEKMPRTAALMRSAARDAGVISGATKKQWARKRPPAQDERVTATLDLPASDSYPSGHSIAAMTWACLLARLAPDKEQELLQRARLVAYDRVLVGVHYPTDVAAGLTLGAMIADEIARSPAFQADLAAARAEWPPKP